MPIGDKHNEIQSIVVTRLIDSTFTDSAIVTLNRSYQFYRVSAVYTAAAGSACTLRVRVCNSGTGPSSGTVISSTIDLNAATNTVHTAYASSSASAFVAEGQYLSLDFAGTIGSLANCLVTVELMAV